MPLLPGQKFKHVTDKKVHVEIVEECWVWHTVLFRQKGVAYRDLRNGKLSVRLIGDFRESFVKE